MNPVTSHPLTLPHQTPMRILSQRPGAAAVAMKEKFPLVAILMGVDDHGEQIGARSRSGRRVPNAYEKVPKQKPKDESGGSKA